MMEPDRDLERLFVAARAEDERYVPSFASALGRRPTTTRVWAPWLRLAVAAAVVTLAVVAGWRLSAPNDPTLVIAFTPGQMHVPTDYLLDMMSYPRAGEIPRIGAADWYPLPPTGDVGPDTRRLP